MFTAKIGRARGVRISKSAAVATTRRGAPPTMTPQQIVRAAVAIFVANEQKSVRVRVDLDPMPAPVQRRGGEGGATVRRRVRREGEAGRRNRDAASPSPAAAPPPPPWTTKVEPFPSRSSVL